MAVIARFFHGFISPQRQQRNARIVAMLLPLLYALLFAPLGFPDMDNGYLTGMAWRVLHGQMPYQDFVYVRPPLPIYVHSLSLWLSYEHHIWVERALYYAMMSCAAYTMVRTLGGNALHVVLAYAVAVHNFEAQPWHTTDGIFWGAIGIGLLARRHLTWGLLCCCAAAASKQPFYLLPIAATLGALLLYRREAMRAVALVVGSIGLGFMAMAVRKPTLLAAFFHQTTGATRLEDLWQAGVVEYAIPASIIALVLFLIKYKKINTNFISNDMLLRLAANGLLLAVPIAQLYFTLKTQLHFLPFMGVLQGLWLFSCVCAVILWRENREAATAWLLLLLLAWCAGISWGYPSTMLCAAPCLASVWKYIKLYIVIVILFLYIFLNLYPTFDVAFYRLTKRGESIAPALTHLRIGEAQAQQAAEFLALSRRFPTDSFVVFPVYPLAHFLAQRVPTFPADWHRNVDLNWQNDSISLLHHLKNDVAVAYIEKTKLFDMDSPAADCKLGYRVRSRWHKIAETRYWEVYLQPTLPEKNP